MNLSRLFLNPMSRKVRRDLSDPHEMHRTVMSAFPQSDRSIEGARARHGVLYRADVDGRSGRVVLYVQANAEPDWTRLPDGYLFDLLGEVRNPATTSLASLLAAVETGAELTFRLRANATRRVDTKSGPGGERRHGRRVALRGDDARIAWLQRKGASAGFELCSAEASPAVPDVRVVEERTLVGQRRQGEAPLTFAPVLFEGRLRVVDANWFRAALVAGIGPAKAYGFGLLSVAPTRG